MKRFRSIVLAASLAMMMFGTLSASAQNSAAGKTDQAGVIRAVRAMNAGQTAAAEAILKKILAADPANDAAWYYSAICATRQSNIKLAKECLQKAVSLDPGNFWYRQRLATAYTIGGERDKAAAEYESMLAAYPKKTDLYYSLFNIYISKGETGKALRLLDEIDTVSGKNDWTVSTRYSLLLKENRSEEARQMLKDYSDAYPSPQALCMLADLEIGMDRDSTALAYYDEAISLDSNYGPALLGRAEIHRIRKDFKSYFSDIDGIAANKNLPSGGKADYLLHISRSYRPDTYAHLDTTCTILRQTHPGDTAIARAVGLFYYATGREDLSEAVFRDNKDSHPDDRNAISLLLQLLSSRKKYRQMADECYQAAKKFPGDRVYFETANYAEYQLKNYQGIIENCEKLLASKPSDKGMVISAYSTIGDMYNALGDRKQCLKAYDKVLKTDPDNLQVLNNYAYFLSEDGRQLGKAYKMSKKTIEAEPDNPTYLDTFGWILHLQGKDLEAKQFFKHAMLYGGKDSAVILAHYAVVLEKLGETALAESYKRQAKQKSEAGNNK